jgi:hypothetical protein
VCGSPATWATTNDCNFHGYLDCNIDAKKEANRVWIPTLEDKTINPEIRKAVSLSNPVKLLPFQCPNNTKALISEQLRVVNPTTIPRSREKLSANLAKDLVIGRISKFTEKIRARIPKKIVWVPTKTRAIKIKNAFKSSCKVAIFTGPVEVRIQPIDPKLIRKIPGYMKSQRGLAVRRKIR